MNTLPPSPEGCPVPTESGKKLARRIFLGAMARIDVRRVMLSRLRRERDRLWFPGIASSPGKIPQDSVSLARPPRVIAFGKAAARMAEALSQILDGQVRSGLVVAPAVPETRLERFRYFAGGHPYPNLGSLEGGKAALELVSGLDGDDLVIFLVSGGGSAMLEQPFHRGVTLNDLIEFNKLLVTCGLPIEQINVLRKHVSAVKGGRLAARAFPDEQLTIFISDVPEALDSMVASGPTFPDPSTVEECYALAGENGLTSRLPASLRRHFELRTLEETPKPGDPRFSRSHYVRLLSNRDAVEAARAAAEDAGEQAGQKAEMLAEVYAGPWDADFREVARANAAALDALERRHPGRPVCLVSGGEVICPVTGPGVGGRNQAFVLYAATLIAGRNRVVLSAGTDGRDGNSPASGAVADGASVARARALGLDPERYLSESDSYNFFRKLGDALETGYTDNNVRDIRLWLAL